jgi:GH35 family endo-1,4-beta-xylanase
MVGRWALRSRKPSFDRFGPAPGRITLAKGIGMQTKIPGLAWGMLLALAPGLGAQEQSLAAAYERYFPIGAAVDPEMLRGHNDYGSEAGLKHAKAFPLARALKAWGLLDGVGIQGHWSIHDQAGPNGLTAVTFWGLADERTWLDEFPVRGRKDWPLPFDAEHRPKRALWAIVQ